MASYLPPSEDLPGFNPAVFSDNFTPDQVDSKIKTLETEMDAQQTKTTALETKTTGLSYNSSPGADGGTTTLSSLLNSIKTSTNIVIRESNINFQRNDGSSSADINYQSEGLTFIESRGGDATSIVMGGNDTKFFTGASGTDEKLTITNDAQPTINIGKSGSTRGSKIQMEGVAGDVELTHSIIETRSYSGTDDSEMVLFKGNDSSDDRIRLRSGKLAFDCFTGASSDQTAENIVATIDSNGLDILLNPITATGINTGEDTWDIRIPIQCRLAKTISNSSATSIRLPKAIGNFSAGSSTAMVYLVNISRADGDWATGDSPSFLGVLQLSTFAGKKGKIYTVSGASNDITSVAVAEDGSDIDLQVQLSTGGNTDCVITLTQIR